jgi:mannose-6-phosphate isomerase
MVRAVVAHQKVGQPLFFEEHYFERIWGGRGLAERFGKALPADTRVGETWLISDHPSAESVVASGAWTGRTLHDLIELDAEGILGTRPKLTPGGRFPLLLKLLDCNDILSVQVHPDDECAARLGEPDSGKTEMWHVLHTEPAAELICGLLPGIDKSRIESALREGKIMDTLQRVQVRAGDSVTVPAGTVHAIGKGIILAEIQQNSDITYRLHDWDRVDASGKARALHVEKSLGAIHFGRQHPGVTRPLDLPASDCAHRQLLAATRYFAAERIEFSGEWVIRTSDRSFHIVLAIIGQPKFLRDNRIHDLPPGNAILIPSAAHEVHLLGHAAVLDYYVPDLHEDIRRPLSEVGYTETEIRSMIV